LITRLWGARAAAAREQEYTGYFRQTVLPELRAVEGFLGAELLRQRGTGEVGFLVLTRWASMDAVRAFAGDNVETAVVHPQAAAMLIEFDRTVRHYEVVEETLAAKRPGV
jgi:heme-degrading monooxygenase HmoA